MKRSAVDPADCHASALRMLASRDLSTFQLRQRLGRRGFPATAIDDAVARLTGAGLLDDRRVALALARSQRDVKRHGRYRALNELEAAGIGRALAREAIDETFGGVDEPRMIAEAIARRHRREGPLAPAELRRLQAYLIRLGFSADAVVRALKTRGAADDD